MREDDRDAMIAGFMAAVFTIPILLGLAAAFKLVFWAWLHSMGI